MITPEGHEDVEIHFTALSIFDLNSNLNVFSDLSINFSPNVDTE